jgi:serine/threonine protein kinase
MSDYFGPGSIFAGCRLEAIAGRGGMGVVFRATQLALERPVALKAIAPEFAADNDYRERFQRESHLAASLDHPNVIPVYEAGESGGMLYLIMRWVEGTDLRTLLTTSGRVSPVRAIRLLRPVASALAAAHRRGLVHRDIKPANVLITRGEEEEDEGHIYLTDFGIARRTDGESLTRTGQFVGTADYAAPERIKGGRGEAPSDIYAFGCMLYETVTGHVPFDRPTDVSRMFAHLNDPIPSAREEVDGIPEQLDAIIALTMAKRPEDRVGSASELTVALGQVLHELETDARRAAERKHQPAVTKVRTSPAVTDAAAAVTAPSGSSAETAAAVTELVTSVTEPTAPSPAPTIPGDDRKRVARRPRRLLAVWVVPIALLAGAGVLALALIPGGHPGNAGATSTPTFGSAPNKVAIQGSGLSEGLTIDLSSPPRAISADPQNVWVSLPDRGELVRLDPNTGTPRILATGGTPTAIAAGPSALWVAGTAQGSLAQFNGNGEQVAVRTLPGTPTAIAVDPHNSSAWVADSSGAITHVAPGGAVIGTPAKSNPPATSIGWGEAWVWATNGADNGLIRVSLDTSGSSTAFPVGPDPVSVTFDQGVWTAHANGHVTRFDPRSNKLRVNTDKAISSELDAIAATDPGPYVWAISNSAKTLYRITNTGSPAVTGTVAFGSPPVALALAGNSVWVATQDGKITEFRF